MAIKNKKILSKICTTALVVSILTNQITMTYASANELSTVTYAAGHGTYKSDKGAYDYGAVAIDGTNEHDICIDINEGIKEGLESFGIKNASISNRSASIGERVAFAKKLNSFNIDTHNNAGDPSANGFELFIDNDNDKDFTNRMINLTNSFCEKVGFNNRGVKTDKDSRLKKLAVTYTEGGYSILPEFGFITNSKDYSKLDTKEKRKVVGFIFATELVVSFGLTTRESADSKISATYRKYGVQPFTDAISVSSNEVNSDISSDNKKGRKLLNIDDAKELLSSARNKLRTKPSKNQSKLTSNKKHDEATSESKESIVSVDSLFSGGKSENNTNSSDKSLLDKINDYSNGNTDNTVVNSKNETTEKLNDDTSTKVTNIDSIFSNSNNSSAVEDNKTANLENKSETSNKEVDSNSIIKNESKPSNKEVDTESSVIENNTESKDINNENIEESADNSSGSLLDTIKKLNGIPLDTSVKDDSSNDDSSNNTEKPDKLESNSKFKTLEEQIKYIKESVSKDSNTENAVTGLNQSSSKEESDDKSDSDEN